MQKKFPLNQTGKTFKPKKKHTPGTKRYELHKHAKSTLGNAESIYQAVLLPEGEDINEWFAANTVDFFNQTNMIYGNIIEDCVPENKTCETIFEYLWADENIKKPIKVSAPEYVDHLMNWIQDLLDNETVFPSKVDIPFPKNFRDIVKQIFKRLFRVYAHIYYSHFDKIVTLQEEANLNSAFKHFYYFITEFDLVEKVEMQPLEELITNLTKNDAFKKKELVPGQE